MARHNPGAHALSVLENENADLGTPPATVPPFQAVYERYFDFVWATARRMGVDGSAIDDVVQEIFIAVNASLPRLQRPEALKSWVYSVARRTVANHHRAVRARGGKATTVVDDQLESQQPTPFELTQKNSDLQLLASLLAELDEPKREIFALVEIEEMTVPEVADALAIPVNTAYSRLRAARLAFEAAVARHDARGKGR
ncbi:MAG TPA: sigma-70 family RNA polymerase sigma factor [Polyangiaceae bacterium]|nr:sigma-70 family RNA polymerase sigma factor [Polyangiaceae bacterium]